MFCRRPEAGLCGPVSARRRYIQQQCRWPTNRTDAEVAPSQLPIELYRTDAAPGLAGWVTPRTLAPPTPWEGRAQGLFRAALVEHLMDCLEDGGQPVVGAPHGRHVLEIMLTARQAAREGKTLSLTTTFPS